MFHEIGSKIKILAYIQSIVGVIASIIVTILLELGFWVAVVGSVLAWCGSFLLYGFGQLIENTDMIVDKLSGAGGSAVSTHFTQKKESNAVLTSGKTAHSVQDSRRTCPACFSAVSQADTTCKSCGQKLV